MQTEKPKPVKDTMIHPAPEDWMSLLYDEVLPSRKRELQDHLVACGECSARVAEWRAGLRALDAWKPKAVRRPSHAFATPMAWGVAAALALAAFFLGRVSTNSSTEIAALKQTVAELSTKVDGAAPGMNAVLTAARSAANLETVRLLTEYDTLQAAQHRTEQETVKAALAGLDSRLGRLRSELATVAVNTQEGFAETHQNLAQLVSYSPGPRGRDQ